MSVIISSLEKFQTEYTGTRPGDISISSCIGSFRSLIQTLFLDCNNNVARQEKWFYYKIAANLAQANKFCYIISLHEKKDENALGMRCRSVIIYQIPNTLHISV